MYVRIMNLSTIPMQKQLLIMESVEAGEADIVRCRYCRKEINSKNMEDHLNNCPMEEVVCGWCELRQSRNVFREHIKLVNPEKEINNVQQCMQRQCYTLFKQQEKFSTLLQEQQRQSDMKNEITQLNQQNSKLNSKFNTFLQEQQKLSDDIKNQITQLNQQNSKFNGKFQQYTTQKSFMVCVVLMLIINFSHIFYHLYWLQSPQVIHSQIDTLKLLLDNHNSEIKFLQEDLREIKAKHKTSRSFRKKLKDLSRDINSTKLDFGLECLNVITKLNQSIGDETKKLQVWMIKMEENCTKIFDLASEVNDQLNVADRLNQSIISATKQWHTQLVELERNFTTVAEITNLKSEINDQLSLIIKLNQTLLNKTKQWQKPLMEVEENFNVMAEISDLRSEITDVIIKLNQTMLNETKKWQKQLIEMEVNFSAISEITDLRSEVNDQLNLIIKLNHTMLHETKQEQKHLTEMEEIPQYKYKNLLELKLLNSILPTIFKLPNFSEKMKNMEEWYGNSFLAFNGGYLMILEVCVTGYGDGKGTHVSVFLRLMRGPYDNELQQSGHWPLRGTFTLKLLNQFNDDDHYNREVIFSTYTCNECTKRVIDANLNANRWGYPQFISHKVIQQRKDNKHLYFNVSYDDVNPLIPCNQIAPVILKMFSLSEKINNKEQWYSSPFFAFDGGYQMCLKVYATSYYTGKDTYANLSVSIHLMKGPHDDKLQQSGHWPISGTFTIKLLNQISDHHHSIKFSKNGCNKCIKRVITGDMAAEWGEVFFILPLQDINSYKSNTLNFKIFYEADPSLIAQTFSLVARFVALIARVLALFIFSVASVAMCIGKILAGKTKFIKAIFTILISAIIVNVTTEVLCAISVVLGYKADRKQCMDGIRF